MSPNSVDQIPIATPTPLPSNEPLLEPAACSAA